MSDELTSYKGKPAGRGVKKCMPRTAGDLTASMDLILSSIATHKATPFKYPPTAAGLETFKLNCTDFFRYVAELNANEELETKLIPDIESLCLYIGIDRHTLMNYEARGGTWGETVRYFKNCLVTAKKQLALNYKIPPVLEIFDLKCNHGYIEPTAGNNEGIEGDNCNRTEELTTAAGLIFDPVKGEFVAEGE